MSVDVMAFAAGVLFVGVAILGGGLEIQQLKIPAVNQTGRALFFLAGVASIVLSLYLSVYVSASKTTGVASNPAPSSLPPASALKTNSAQTLSVAADAGEANANRWLNIRELHQELDSKGKDGFYPANIIGKCDGEVEKFELEWKERPLGLATATRAALTKEEYDNDSERFSADGFSLDFMHTFKDCSGHQRFEAQWVRTK